jgi:hypothetical protein
MRNPFLSLWLSQTNAWAGAARGLWTAELQRQQTQLMNEFTKQALRFWSGGWMVPPTDAAAPRRRQALARQQR